jgi:hypothetical protein
VRHAGTATKLSWKAGTTTMKVLGDILEESSAGGGGGFGGGSLRPTAQRELPRCSDCAGCPRAPGT